MTTGPDDARDESVPPFDPATFRRPDPRLRSYYVLTCFLLPPFSLIGLIPLLLRYASLRYSFDDEGVHMSWGVLFKKEVALGYRRIQDIHVTRGLLQRWFGIATVSVQTASASSMPEMKIEGVRDPRGLRDYLYSRTRGASATGTTATAEAGERVDPATADDEALELLREIRDLLAEGESTGTTRP